LSTGRAIRHKGDYATIVLVDQRYSRQSIIRRLPDWIATRMLVQDSFAKAFSAANSFFRSKQE
jgi:chromosome transmission fidelity protein 1